MIEELLAEGGTSADLVGQWPTLWGGGYLRRDGFVAVSETFGH
jgi:hypothetical protein